LEDVKREKLPKFRKERKDWEEGGIIQGTPGKRGMRYDREHFKL